MGFWQNLKSSFMDSFSDIVFGMEDGTVSIAGLVFGVAFSANSSTPVLVAGASGAVAAAISMAAGAYLDTESSKAMAQWKLKQEKREVKNKPEEEKREARKRLEKAGFEKKHVDNIMEAMESTPGALERFETITEVQVGSAAQSSPIAHAGWMLAADIIAAFTPVIPFMIFSLSTARIVALVAAGVLIIVLGVARALIAHMNLWATVGKTFGIAAFAAAAGVFVGQYMSGGGPIG